jgi:hypothetical protein
MVRDFTALQEEWMMRLRDISEGMTENIARLLGMNFDYQVRYRDNGLRVWFVPVPTREEGFTRPFAEEPCAKDK